MVRAWLVHLCLAFNQPYSFTAICKIVGGCHFRQFGNKQDKIDPKLGFAVLNGVYSPMLPNYF